MKTQLPHLALVFLFSITLNAAAVTRYVGLNSTSPTPPYTSWSTAATNIQDAVDSAVAGDLVLVTNGLYSTGGRVASGALTNRVVVDRPVTVKSVNGPVLTIIQGFTIPVTTYGEDAVRCVFLASNGILSGFTLTNGATQPSGSGIEDSKGGGVLGQDLGSTHPSIVSNCVIAGNSAGWGGGGAASVTLQNCLIVGNKSEGASFGGGGAFECELINCVLRTNISQTGGGAMLSILRNCTVVENHAGGVGNGSATHYGVGGGVCACTVFNSIVYSNSAEVDGDNHNPYYGSGLALDFTCTTPLPGGGIGNITDDPQFADVANGDLHLSPTSPCIDSGNNSFAPIGFDFEGNQRITGGFVDIGAYESQGYLHVSTNLYVDVNSTNPVPPYTNWYTAATVIQDALDVSQAGDEIVVADGVYRIGGRVMAGVTNRVAVIGPIKLRSVNGPGKTIIEGFQAPGTIVGESAIRCAFLGGGATMTGFTLTNGATQTFNIENQMDNAIGAGVFCQSTTEVISNCVFINNRAAGVAGGIYRGTVYYSVISSNSAFFGGGVDSSILNRCVVRGNSANYGAGARGGALANCLLIHNSASTFGGGAMNATLTNCTVSANEAMNLSEGGGGVYSCSVQNCIIYANTAPAFPNYYSSDANYSCTFPLPASGAGNITNSPLLVDLSGGNFRLQTNSPCLDSGSNAYVSSSVDLDDRQRIQGGVVDIGAYEFQGAGMSEFIGWLQSFALPTDGSADFTDADGDRMNNYSEWRADTIPTNGLSLLRMISATNGTSGAVVTWQSVTTRSYWLERSSDPGLGSPFQTIATNIAGVASTKTFTDTTATNNGPYFYRVGVE